MDNSRESKQILLPQADRPVSGRLASVMHDARETESADTPARPLIDARAVAVLAVAAAVLLGVLLVSRAGQQWGVDPHADGGVGSAATPVQAVPVDAEEATLAMAHAEAKALSTNKVIEALGIAESASSNLDDAASYVQEWASLEQSILDGEAGRRIAADEGLTRRYIALVDARNTDRVSAVLASHRSRLRELVAPLESMDDSDSSIHSPTALIVELNELRDESRGVGAIIRDHVRALNAIEIESRSVAPVELELRDAIAVVGGEAAQDHADHLKRIAEEGAKKRREHQAMIAQRQQQMSAIASSPRAREILWFITDAGSRLWDPYCGRAFADLEFFRDTLVHSQISQRYGISSDNRGRNARMQVWDQLENEAKAAFDLSLHQLFRVFLLSQSNRDEFLVTLEETKAIASDSSGHSSEIRRSASHWLSEGRPLPKPTLP